MMLSDWPASSFLYFLGQETITLWRSDRTKTLRFVCSLLGNLNTVWAWVERSNKVVYMSFLALDSLTLVKCLRTLCPPTSTLLEHGGPLSQGRFISCIQGREDPHALLALVACQVTLIQRNQYAIWGYLGQPTLSPSRVFSCEWTQREMRLLFSCDETCSPWTTRS